jgi:hypothetical protein
MVDFELPCLIPGGYWCLLVLFDLWLRPRSSFRLCKCEAYSTDIQWQSSDHRNLMKSREMMQARDFVLLRAHTDNRLTGCLGAIPWIQWCCVTRTVWKATIRPESLRANSLEPHQIPESWINKNMFARHVNIRNSRWEIPNEGWHPVQ